MPEHETYRVVISKRAAQQLVEHAAFIARLDEKLAHKLVSDFRQAAESLERHAKAKGIKIKVETQGAIGIENKITLEDIKKADAVILTNNIEIEDVERFEEKYILKVSVKDLVRNPDEVLQKVQNYVNGISS